MPINSDKVADNFSRGARNYERSASFQRLAATALAEAIAAAEPMRGGRVLEIGCGTGFLTRHLLQQDTETEFLLCDISAAMLKRCSQTLSAAAGRCQFHLLDIGRRVPDGPFRLATAALALQWVSPLPPTLGRIHAALEPGGMLAFSTLTSGTFANLRAAFAHAAAAYPGPEFLSEETVAAACRVFREIRVETRRIEVESPSPVDFLAGLRAIGAGNASDKPTPPGKMRRILEHLAPPPGAPFTTNYQLTLAICRK